eukprot:1191461-Prorocentrum_minimum.AAC.1
MSFSGEVLEWDNGTGILGFCKRDTDYPASPPRAGYLGARTLVFPTKNGDSSPTYTMVNLHRYLYMRPACIKMEFVSGFAGHFQGFMAWRTSVGASRLASVRSKSVLQVRAKIEEPVAEEEAKKSVPALPYTAPEPKTFYVDPDQLSDIAGAALPFGIRLGTGGFTSGYSIGLGPNDEYAPNSPHSPRLIKPDL